MLFDEVFQGARMDSHDHGGLFACGFIDGILGCGFERRVELFPRDIASEGAHLRQESGEEDLGASVRRGMYDPACFSQRQRSRAFAILHSRLGFPQMRIFVPS